MRSIKVPKGYKLVPIEPTIEMVMAGEDAFEKQLDVRLNAIISDAPYAVYPSEQYHSLCSRLAYKAMLESTPPLKDGEK